MAINGIVLPLFRDQDSYDDLPDKLDLLFSAYTFLVKIANLFFGIDEYNAENITFLVRNCNGLRQLFNFSGVVCNSVFELYGLENV